jgi:hypothetical protein
MTIYIFLFMSTPEEMDACSLCEAANKLHNVNVTYAEQNVKPERTLHLDKMLLLISAWPRTTHWVW